MSAFRPYFGSLNPLLVIAGSLIVGVGSLLYLRTRAGFELRSAEVRRGLTRAAQLATLLAAIIILVDLAAVWPADTNVAPPGSFVFYPVIAWVAETAFHLAPLAILLLLFGRAARADKRKRVVWACLAAVALIEPALQVVWAGDAQIPEWARVYTGLHLLAINAVQLWLFRRYDFVSMLAFRLVYYLYWHIGWGWLRLHLLF